MHMTRLLEDYVYIHLFVSVKVQFSISQIRFLKIVISHFQATIGTLFDINQPLTIEKMRK